MKYVFFEGVNEGIIPTAEHCGTKSELSDLAWRSLKSAMDEFGPIKGKAWFSENCRVAKIGKLSNPLEMFAAEFAKEEQNYLEGLVEDNDGEYEEYLRLKEKFGQR